MFDEQIKLFPNATETAAALYWRGRLYEQENNRAQAAQNYRSVSRVYQHFFYAANGAAEAAGAGRAVVCVGVAGGDL